MNTACLLMALSVVVINYDFGHRRFSCWCTITTSDTDRLNSARVAKGPAHRMEIGDHPHWPRLRTHVETGALLAPGRSKTPRQVTFKSLKLSFVI